VSPLAGIDALDLLCRRNYRPLEISSVLYRQVEQPASESCGDVRVRLAGPEEADLWSNISARGWAHDIRSFSTFFYNLASSLLHASKV
jgi:hypothetical protein